MISIFGAGKEEKELLSKVWGKGLSIMGAQASEADLTFVGRDRIRELNKETRGVDRVTDVLSFPTIERVKLPLLPDNYPFDVDPETGKVNLGSIVICRSRAKEQADARKAQETTNANATTTATPVATPQPRRAVTTPITFEVEVGPAD